MNKKIRLLMVLFGLTAVQIVFAADEVAPQTDQTQQDKPEDVSPHIIKFASGLGLGYNSYNSTLVSISQYSLITKFGMHYRNKKIEKWALSLNAFVTALPLNSSTIQVGANSDTITIRFLGINARMGWDTPWLTGPWLLQLNFGWYYNTTFVTNDRFGYVGANGPQFFPTITYQIDEKSSLGGYLKFSPMSTGFSILNSDTNYEIAFGANYVMPTLLFGKYRYSINFDFAHLSIKPDTVRAFANSTSLGIGVLF